METLQTKIATIRRKIIIRIVFVFLFLFLCFFLPAQTFNYWEAWIYLIIIFSCVLLVIRHFLKHDPLFLERRIRTKETVKEQKIIIYFGWILFLPIFILPGFDKFYGWSKIPILLIIISQFLVLTGYLIVYRVFKENSFASRVIEINEGQKVISTGPYSIVRHPMYFGVLLMYGFTPLALGSYWAFIGSFFLIIILVARTLSEERYLSKNLQGYEEYMQKVKYRIIPYIW